MRRQNPGHSRLSGAVGFTLIELMVTIAVVAIIASIAAPAMQSLIAANRLSSASTEVVTALQLARSEATRRNARVTVCASDDGAVCAAKADWSRWIVTGRDNATGNVEQIRDFAVSGKVQVEGPPGGISFRPSGLLDAQSVLTVCTPSSHLAENQRVVTMMVGGSVATTKENGGGVCP